MLLWRRNGWRASALRCVGCDSGRRCFTASVPDAEQDGFSVLWNLRGEARAKEQAEVFALTLLGVNQPALVILDVFDALVVDQPARKIQEPAGNLRCCQRILELAQRLPGRNRIPGDLMEVSVAAKEVGIVVLELGDVKLGIEAQRVLRHRAQMR